MCLLSCVSCMHHFHVSCTHSCTHTHGAHTHIQVLDKYHPPDYYLPESYTCFFLLKIPRYSCKLVLEEKLRYAINFCKSIDTDDYARVNLQEGLIDEEEEEEEIGGEGGTHAAS